MTMKVLEVKMDRLRQIILTLEGRGGSSQWFEWELANDKEGGCDERDARENSLHTGRRLSGGKMTGRKERGRV